MADDDEFGIRDGEWDKTPREWLLLNSVRQMISIAQRRQATYAEATVMALDLAPALLEGSVLIEASESEIESLYKARAEAQTSQLSRPVLPISLIDEDIATLSGELETAPARRAGDIAAQIVRLERAKGRLETIRWTESQSIRQDSETLGLGIKLPISDLGRDYRDYKFHTDRTLRVRILHPDPGEWKSGVDLIYESYWRYPGRRKAVPQARRRLVVRVAALQYKMWNGKRIYLSSDPRLELQVDRARGAFCGEGLCEPGRRIRRRYGLPHCSAFLRPTDMHQRRRGFSTTHGWHLPMCEAKRELSSYQSAPRIDSKRISSSSVSQTVFAELFNRNMLGSRWTGALRLEGIYKRTHVLRADDRVVVHAQEFSDEPVDAVLSS